MDLITSHSRGFTLIELVTVILVLGILSVVALPRFFDATTFTSRGFYDEMTSAVRYAQKLAVASGCDVRLNIAGGNYALHQRQLCDHASGFNRAVSQPAGSGSFAGSSPSGVPLSSTYSNIIFDAQGRATSGGVPVNVMVKVGDRSFTIIGESGYVDTP